MAKPHKMICPSCKVEMNHHAEKLDYATALAEPRTVDAELGAILTEAHACPKCGKTAARRA